MTVGETFCLGASVEPGILLALVHLSVLVRASAGQQKWARAGKADSSQRIWENSPNHIRVVDILISEAGWPVTWKRQLTVRGTSGR